MLILSIKDEARRAREIKLPGSAGADKPKEQQTQKERKEQAISDAPKRRSY